MRVNCWEYKKCGRELGGKKVAELGVCPASVEKKVNGINSGRNAGRTCWVVTGTLCESRVQGDFEAKLITCLNCDFYQFVHKEEKKNFVFPDQVLKRFYKSVKK